MDTLRCPTCLTLLLDGGEKRCPGCHAKLKRSKPIVLGEDSRITSRPTLLLERERQARIDEEKRLEERKQRRDAKKAARSARDVPAIEIVDASPVVDEGSTAPSAPLWPLEATSAAPAEPDVDLTNESEPEADTRTSRREAKHARRHESTLEHALDVALSALPPAGAERVAPVDAVAAPAVVPEFDEAGAAPAASIASAEVDAGPAVVAEIVYEPAIESHVEPEIASPAAESAEPASHDEPAPEAGARVEPEITDAAEPAAEAPIHYEREPEPAFAISADIGAAVPPADDAAEPAPLATMDEDQWQRLLAQASGRQRTETHAHEAAPAPATEDAFDDDDVDASRPEPTSRWARLVEDARREVRTSPRAEPVDANAADVDLELEHALDRDAADAAEPADTEVDAAAFGPDAPVSAPPFAGETPVTDALASGPEFVAAAPERPEPDARTIAGTDQELPTAERESDPESPGRRQRRREVKQALSGEPTPQSVLFNETDDRDDDYASAVTAPAPEAAPTPSIARIGAPPNHSDSEPPTDPEPRGTSRRQRRREARKSRGLEPAPQSVLFGSDAAGADTAPAPDAEHTVDADPESRAESTPPADDLAVAPAPAVTEPIHEAVPEVIQRPAEEPAPREFFSPTSDLPIDPRDLAGGAPEPIRSDSEDLFTSRRQRRRDAKEARRILAELPSRLRAGETDRAAEPSPPVAAIIDIAELQREAARQRDAELTAQREAEAARRREAELAAQHEIEAARLREAELAAQREAEAEAARLREAEILAQREREAETARLREAELQAQREAEAARLREIELAAQREAEAEAARLREAELAAQREAEAAHLREIELAAQREREAETARLREAELQAQREAEAAHLREIELAAQREREAEAARLREAELAAQREAEAARRREAELQAQREAELAAQREREATRQREAELAAQREAEAARQREAEAARRREAELRAEREAEAARQRDAALAALVAQREADAARLREAELAAEREALAARQRAAELAAQLEAEAALRREAEAARIREAEAARQREAEVARQREAEAARLREIELAAERAREAEAARLREVELAAQREAEAARLREAELAAERAREAEAARQREVELAAQREAALAAQREAEAEAARRHEAELQAQRDAEAERQREAEQLEAEAAERAAEAEAARQREAELAAQREAAAARQREAEQREADAEAERQREAVAARQHEAEQRDADAEAAHQREAEAEAAQREADAEAARSRDAEPAPAVELLIAPVAVETPEMMTANDKVEVAAVTAPEPVAPNREAKARGPKKKKVRRQRWAEANRDVGRTNSSWPPAPVAFGTDFIITPITDIDVEPAVLEPLADNDPIAESISAPIEIVAEPVTPAEPGPAAADADIESAATAIAPAIETETDSEPRISRRQRRRDAKAARLSAETATGEAEAPDSTDTTDRRRRRDAEHASPIDIAPALVDEMSESNARVAPASGSRDAHLPTNILPTIEIGEEPLLVSGPGPFRPALDLTIEPIAVIRRADSEPVGPAAADGEHGAALPFSAERRDPEAISRWRRLVEEAGTTERSAADSEAGNEVAAADIGAPTTEASRLSIVEEVPGDAETIPDYRPADEASTPGERQLVGDAAHRTDDRLDVASAPEPIDLEVMDSEPEPAVAHHESIPDTLEVAEAAPLAGAASRPAVELLDLGPNAPTAPPASFTPRRVSRRAIKAARRVDMAKLIAQVEADRAAVLAAEAARAQAERATADDDAPDTPDAPEASSRGPEPVAVTPEPAPEPVAGTAHVAPEPIAPVTVEPELGSAIADPAPGPEAQLSVATGPESQPGAPLDRSRRRARRRERRRADTGSAAPITVIDPGAPVTLSAVAPIRFEPEVDTTFAAEVPVVELDLVPPVVDVAAAPVWAPGQSVAPTIEVVAEPIVRPVPASEPVEVQAAPSRVDTDDVPESPLAETAVAETAVAEADRVESRPPNSKESRFRRLIEERERVAEPAAEIPEPLSAGAAEALTELEVAPEIAAVPEPEVLPEVAVAEIVPAAAAHDRNGPVQIEVVDARPVAPMSRKLPERTRALRVTTTRKNGRKRWSFDVLVQAPDAPSEDE